MESVVVDTNILFSFFWKNSFTRRLLTTLETKFISPEYALEEINGKKEEIKRKANLTEKEFSEIRKDLATYVDFIPLEEYEDCLKKAASIPDSQDVDFIALALKRKLILWSNDGPLKKQSLAPVLSTKEIMELIS